MSQPLTSEDFSSDGKSAKLTFTLINPLENGEVLYAYPASMLDENGLIKEDSFYTQNGTLSDAAGGDSLPAGSSYWTSTEDGTVYAHYVFLGNNGNASFGSGAHKEENSFRVRAVFAF